MVKTPYLLINLLNLHHKHTQTPQILLLQTLKSPMRPISTSTLTLTFHYIKKSHSLPMNLCKTHKTSSLIPCMPNLSLNRMPPILTLLYTILTLIPQFPISHYRLPTPKHLCTLLHNTSPITCLMATVR